MSELDYGLYETAKAEPDAISMFQTFRAIGYSVETAAADIIDNSITAGAKNIWFDYEWKGPDTIISIADDGSGMSNEEIISALKPGSKNPLEARSPDDLGRFGLGLKTASFSQCRKFCVVSKSKESDVSFWSWDLDFVNTQNAWNVIKYCPLGRFVDELSGKDTGTVVIWWDIDRLTKETNAQSSDDLNKFMQTMESVKRHLGMVFHRFIAEGIRIHFRGRKIDGWDPFMTGIDGVQLKPESRIQKGKVILKGYILPHRSKLTDEWYSYGKGPKDSWTAHQGFYVYRNKRLLVPGDWLGFFKREVHYDLCRIQVDLPNDIDADWQIDIKKSLARPPLSLREQILSYAKDVRMSAVEVYRHRGKVVKRKFMSGDFKPMWEEKRRHGKRFYEINRSHPLIAEILSNLENRKMIERLLSYIEETVPVPLIVLKESENDVQYSRPFEGANQELLMRDIKAMYTALLAKGNTREQAKDVIYKIEPYDHFPELIENIEKI